MRPASGTRPAVIAIILPIDERLVHFPVSPLLDSDKYPIIRGLKAIAKRWPELHKGYLSDPVFIMSSGPGSGAEELAASLEPGCHIWLDALSTRSPIDSLADHIRMFTTSWPPDAFFADPYANFEKAYRPSANYYPRVDLLLKSHRSFVERMFADPARRAGAFTWGIYNPTWNSEHAYYLNWLFPKARFLLLYRHPMHAYQDYVERGDRINQLVNLTPLEFARHWTYSVMSFVEHHKGLNALAIAYEQLPHPDTKAKIESYLGFRIQDSFGKQNSIAASKLSAINDLKVGQLREFQKTVEGLANKLGYSLPVSSTSSGATGGKTCHNSKCVVLVPYLDSIEPQCEHALRTLEARGYVVRRAHGFTAIDVARNVLVTRALDEGFEEVLWVDDDMNFSADAVDRLRSHGEPLIGGIVAKRGQRAFASMFSSTTDNIKLGKWGGVVEVDVMGTGFMLIHREVFAAIQQKFKLPRCVEKGGQECIPFFMPNVLPVKDGNWYLAEDYAFVQRAKDCGYRMLADTTLRLGHIGSYEYSWEDVGIAKPHLDSFKYDF